ncbi:NRAMP family [Zopfochytrium polystomum]|nr:NRAMP family [Zopfochytrium polystomum]
MRFMGPGFMVGVGYLDPGNWATDLASGSEFGYSLLYIVLIANLMAIVLQYLCIKLGVVTGLDLAMACKKYLPERLSMFFYILCQLAIIATDCAEVIGTAIALDLLFGIPLVWGVALTGLDVLVILALWDANNLKAFEKAILFLVALVALCFVYLLTLSNPDWALVGRGLIPTTEIFRSSSMLYLAMSIIGATIMPHNLYLHSSIVRYRSGKQVENLGEITEPEPMTPRSARTPRTPALPSPGTLAQIEEDMGIEIQAPQRKEFIPQTLMFSNIDSVVALTGALLVNGAILTVSAASFHNSGEEVGELKDAYNLLVHHLGSIAGVAFALALLAAGQSSTITGTLTGQIVTEGFLGTEYAVEPWLQRLITRALAITPAMLVCFIAGESGVNQLLVFSQVVLSLQLPFAIWPLVWITSDKEKMTVVFPAARVDGHHVFEERSYENSRFLHWVAVFIAILITIFNVILIVEVFDGAASYIYASLF